MVNKPAFPTRRNPSRRDCLRAALLSTALGFGRYPISSFGFPPLEEGETLVPFLDSQPTNPERPMLQWDRLESWITPESQFFTVQHYGVPEVNPETWRLELSGRVRKPASYSLDEIKHRPRHEYVATQECAGNGASPKFQGAVGNARWAGTLLAPLLQAAGLEDDAREVVFYAADRGKETIRGQEYLQNFARSLPLDVVRGERLMLVYEMNGQPLPKSHGGPVRLGVPGAYGVAWVKWLQRMEAMNRRFAGRFMARDYVTIRGEKQGNETVWLEKLVTWMNLKSVVARVVRRRDQRCGLERWQNATTQC